MLHTGVKHNILKGAWAGIHYARDIEKYSIKKFKSMNYHIVRFYLLAYIVALHYARAINIPQHGFKIQGIFPLINRLCSDIRDYGALLANRSDRKVANKFKQLRDEEHSDTQSEVQSAPDICHHCHPGRRRFLSHLIHDFLIQTNIYL